MKKLFLISGGNGNFAKEIVKQIPSMKCMRPLEMKWTSPT